MLGSQAQSAVFHAVLIVALGAGQLGRMATPAIRAEVRSAPVRGHGGSGSRVPPPRGEPHARDLEEVRTRGPFATLAMVDLARARVPGTVELLAAVLLDPRAGRAIDDRRLRSVAVRALAIHGGDRARGHLEAAMASPSFRDTHLDLAKALARIGDHRSLPALARARRFLAADGDDRPCLLAVLEAEDACRIRADRAARVS